MKQAIRDFVLNMKRVGEIAGRTYFSHRFLFNPIVPVAKYEKHMRKVFESSMTIKTGTIIDVGANIGQTLNTFISIDPDCSYIGFEPQSYACSLVEMYIIDNRIKNKKVLPIGLSNKKGVVSFESFGDGQSIYYNTGGMIVTGYKKRDRRSAKRNIFVDVGDDVLDSLSVQDVSLVKIDVEGAEFDVLEGLNNTIYKFRPFVTLEILPPKNRLDEGVGDYIKDIDNILHWASENKYIVYKIDSNGFTSELIRDNAQPESRLRDYIAVPNEHNSKWMEVNNNVSD